jgi:hypothetical protein
MRVKVFRADSTLRPLPSGLSERRRPPGLGERKKIAGPLGRHLTPFPGGGMRATCASTREDDLTGLRWRNGHRPLGQTRQAHQSPLQRLLFRAYDANNLSTPLYASNQAGSRDTAGNGLHFITPTIANGHVYLGTQFEVDVYGLLPRTASTSHAVGTPASTVPTRQRSVVAAAAPARRSRENSAVGPLPSAGRLVGLAAAAPAGATTTRISRAAAAPIVAPNSGPRAGGGARPLLTQSGSGIAALNDLVISQSDGVNGLVSLPGLKKNRSGHLS